jgi:hypothetical protein
MSILLTLLIALGCAFSTIASDVDPFITITETCRKAVSNPQFEVSFVSFKEKMNMFQIATPEEVDFDFALLHEFIKGNRRPQGHTIRAFTDAYPQFPSPSCTFFVEFKYNEKVIVVFYVSYKRSRIEHVQLGTSTYEFSCS